MASEQLLNEYNAAHRLAAWFDLSDHSKIEITGADRAAFLHNFCTNDIKGLPVGRGCEAFICNARGKILAYIRVFAHDDALWLDTAPSLGPKIKQHLDKFVISEDVTIADQTGKVADLMITGPHDIDMLAGGGMAAEDMTCTSGRLPLFDAEVMLWRADFLGLPAHHLIVPAEKRDRFTSPWKGSHIQAARACYEILRVEAGTPEYGQDIDEGNYPQEVGRDAKTISFTKGCYLGQEPIVMIRDRGQVSRLLVGLKLGGTDAAAHGAKIWSSDKEVGHITSSVVSPRFGVIALGYVRRGSHEAGTALQVEMADGQRVDATVSKLPFS